MENQNPDLKKLMEDVEKLKDEKSFLGTTKSFTKGLFIGLALTSVVAFAITVTKPHTFSSGTPISAAEVNANFDTLYDYINNNDLGYTARYSANQNITCTPYPPVLNKSTPDIVDFNDGNLTSGTYTVSVNGTYVFYYLLYSAAAMGTAFEIRVNGTPVLYPYTSAETKPIRLAAGDAVELWVGCDDKKNPSVTIDATKSFIVLKKL